MSTERKSNYLDMIKQEFIDLAAKQGVPSETAEPLADYLTEKMMRSWRNGLRAGQSGKYAQAPAAQASA